jgi:16S rRNA (cytosine1402-N4)-methyltransferase
MTVISPLRAYTQPLDQQAGGPLLHPSSPMFPGRNPGAALAEGLRMSPRSERDQRDEPGESHERGPRRERGDFEEPGRPGRRASSAEPIGAQPDHTDAPLNFEHRPVMMAEVVQLLEAVPPGIIVDATVGAGGHARALLEASADHRLVGIDRDADAVAAAAAVLNQFGARAVVMKSRFDRLGEILDGLGTPSVAGVLFDLGVSSPQFDRAERGFSYRADAPLDMRMDRSEGMTAAELISSSSEAQLARLFALHGEDRFARRIAAAIVAARPVTSTSTLAKVVSDAVPAAARRRGHPARRVFQALRAAVNEELELLPVAIDAAIDRLMPGGRIVVISYHSGEDRIVKGRFLLAATGGCTCPPGLPCACGAVARARLLNRGARKPSEAEAVANPRARSARLRAAEALPEAKKAEAKRVPR